MVNHSLKMKTTTPKERPILFSGPIVRAILDGKKTQTRRICKDPHFGVIPPETATVERQHIDSFVYVGKKPVSKIHNRETWRGECPYGKPGDRLWVKETFGIGSQNGLNHEADEQVFYRATDPAWDDENTGFKWKPSIFMPRKLSRITLEITAVRVERLQEITEEDAVAEGIHAFNAAQITYYHYSPTAAREEHFRTAVDAYRALWDSINGPESWAQNPWVWVLTFKRIAP
jgi:hypothetical protein